MNKKDFEYMVVDRVQKCEDILIDRGEQYASEKDFLLNFKETAAMLSAVGYQFKGQPLEPWNFAHIMAMVKMQRWGNRMIEGKDPDDDFTDGINYVLLGEGCIKDG